MLVEASVVEPVRPLQRGDPHLFDYLFDRPSRTARLDQLGLVKSVDNSSIIA